MDARKPFVVRCPHCRAENELQAETCRVCHESLFLGVENKENELPAMPAVPPRTFTLGALMLVVALAALCFGVIRVTGLVGVPLAIMLAAALGRIAWVVHRCGVEGRTLSLAQTAVELVMAYGFGIFVGISAAIAFVITCTASDGLSVLDQAVANHPVHDTPSLRGALLGTVAAIMSGLVIAIVVARAVWKKRR